GAGLLWVHVAAAAAWVGTATILGVGARKLVGRHGFAAAVVVYALLRSSMEHRSGVANTEAFLQPLLAAGVALALTPAARPRGAALRAGAALAGAVLFKPPVALYGPACVVAVAATQGRRAAWTTAWAGAAGAALVLGAAAA